MKKFILIAILICIPNTLLAAVLTPTNVARKYQIDMSAVDQGAVTTQANRSLLDIATLAGTTTYITAEFYNSASGVTTQYTLSTSLDLSSYTNMNFYFANGAQIYGSGVTLTLYSPSNIIAAPSQQIFNGVTVVFSSSGTRFPGWWGAKGDGSTDDSTAIQAAGQSLSNGGTLQFEPAKTYMYSGVSPIPLYSNVTIDFNGAILKTVAGDYTGTNLNFIGNEVTVGYDAGQAYIENITIQNGELDGNVSSVTADSHRGIIIEQGKNIKIDNMYIHDTDGTAGGGQGIIIGHSDGLSITRTKIYNTERQNISIWETINARIQDCQLSTSRYRECLLVSGNTPTDLQVSKVFVSDTYFYNTKTANNADLMRLSGYDEATFNNCQFESGTSDIIGIRFNGLLTEKLFVSNSKFYTLSYGIDVNSTGGAQIQLSNIYMSGVSRGISTSTGAGSFFMNNSKIEDSGDRPMSMEWAEYAEIVNNEFNGGTRVQAGNAGHLVFTGNIVTGMTDSSYAVLLSGTAGTHKATAIGNTLTGNTIDKLYGNCTVEAYDNDTGANLIGGSDVNYRGVFYQELNLSGVTTSAAKWNTAIPKDSVVTVVAKLTDDLVFSSGATDWMVGDGSDIDRWGESGVTSEGTQLMPDDYTAGDNPQFFTSSNLNVWVRPYSGQIDSGSVMIRVYVNKFN